jgi:serine/threonine-protein kinase HipA
MDRELPVYVDLFGTPVLAGRLWARARGSKESASFEYDPGWLRTEGGFAFDPELPLGRGQFHTARPLFNAFTGPSPDRWGQPLLRRHERTEARRESRRPRTLLSVDFLRLVDDESRLGALRFKEPGADNFLTTGERRVPPLIESQGP